MTELLVLIGQVLFLIFAIIIQIYLFYTFIHARFGKYPPFFPTRIRVVKMICAELEPFLSQTEPLNVTDLGCGDGRILFRLAEKYPQHRFKGYEWDVVPYSVAKKRAKKFPNVEIFRQDFMKADYTKDNVLILFTGDEIAQELSDKLTNELPDKAVLISECFKLYRIPCIKEISTGKKNFFFLPPTLFLYQVGNKDFQNKAS